MMSISRSFTCENAPQCSQTRGHTETGGKRERERERTRDEGSTENHRDKEHTKSCFFSFLPQKTAQQKPSTRDVLSVPWTRSMDSTWELVNDAGSRRTPSQIYWIRTSILTRSRDDPNTHQDMRNTALEEFGWSCSRWWDDKESSPTSKTQVSRLWTTWIPIIRRVCFKKIQVPGSERPTLM